MWHQYGISADILGTKFRSGYAMSKVCMKIYFRKLLRCGAWSCLRDPVEGEVRQRIPRAGTRASSYSRTPSSAMRPTKNAEFWIVQ
jgi:hypothetical protein